MSKRSKNSPKTRAELAAERGIGVRTLQRNVATEIAALPRDFREHAAQGILLCDRVNTLLPVLRDDGDTARLKQLRDAVAPGAVEVLGIVAPEVLGILDAEDAAP